MTEPETDQRLVAAFWRVVAGAGWNATTMRSVAAEAALPVALLRRRCPDRGDMLRLHNEVIDTAVLAGTVADPVSPPRDRVFDVLMRRIDSLQPHRAGILRLTRETPRDPGLGIQLLAGLPRSMGWMLEAAALGGGARNWLLVPALGAVWLATARAWTRDDSVDLGATMAALDRALDRAEQAGRSLGLAATAEP